MTTDGRKSNLRLDNERSQNHKPAAGHVRYQVQILVGDNWGLMHSFHRYLCIVKLSCDRQLSK
jgi:hypothetical protein